MNAKRYLQRLPVLFTNGYGHCFKYLDRYICLHCCGIVHKQI